MLCNLRSIHKCAIMGIMLLTMSYGRNRCMNEGMANVACRSEYRALHKTFSRLPSF
jgi:hypothetical protein